MSTRTESARLRTALRENGLTLVFAGLFVAALVGQAFTGLAIVNREQAAAALAPISLARYITSSTFAVDVAENWQSEYLQFLLYVLVTVWFVQRGSPESKVPEAAGRAWARARGWRLSVYSRSLTLAMGAIFLGSWLAQSIAGTTAYNASQLRDLQEPVTWAQYISQPEFWNRTLQNWQSEFLAVASMVVLSIYLRERGSPESKPVGTPHAATGVEG